MNIVIMANPYRLSFTSATLRVEETVLLARFLSDHRDGLASEVVPGDLFGNIKQSTHTRLIRELNLRLSHLSTDAISLLNHGTFPEQKNMCYLAVLKTYPFIRHFVENILIANNEVFKTRVEEWQYRDFLNSEEMSHPELKKISDESMKKIKRNTYSILREAGIIAGKMEIQITPLYPGSAEGSALSREEQNWIPYFTLRYH